MESEPEARQRNSQDLAALRAVLKSPAWHKADIQRALIRVRFWGGEDIASEGRHVRW